MLDHEDEFNRLILDYVHKDTTNITNTEPQQYEEKEVTLTNSGNTADEETFSPPPPITINFKAND